MTTPLTGYTDYSYGAGIWRPGRNPGLLTPAPLSFDAQRQIVLDAEKVKRDEETRIQNEAEFTWKKEDRALARQDRAGLLSAQLDEKRKKTAADEASRKAQSEAQGLLEVAQAADALATGMDPQQAARDYPMGVKYLTDRKLHALPPETLQGHAARLRRAAAERAAPNEVFKALLKPEPDVSKDALAESRSLISGMAGEYGVKLKESEIADLSRLAAKQPKLLDAMPQVFQDYADEQKQAQTARGLIRKAEERPWTGLSKDVQSWANPKSWWSDKPQVVGVKRFDTQRDPATGSLVRTPITTSMDAEGNPLTAEKAKALGLPLFTQNDKGLMLGDTPVEAPKPGKPLLERLRGLQAEPTAAPVAPAPTQSSGPVTINSDDEYNQLPSGTIFVGPDGRQRRKP